MDRLVIRSKEHQQELSGIGARKAKWTSRTRSDSGSMPRTKLEDLAGNPATGDSPGG